MDEYIRKEHALAIVIRTQGDYAAAYSEIMRLPKEEVTPPTWGVWIPVPSSDMMTVRAYKCSVCGKLRWGSNLPWYCQNCGARMEKEEQTDG